MSKPARSKIAASKSSAPTAARAASSWWGSTRTLTFGVFAIRSPLDVCFSVRHSLASACDICSQHAGINTAVCKYPPSLAAGQLLGAVGAVHLGFELGLQGGKPLLEVPGGV